MITQYKKRSLAFWGWFLWAVSVPLVIATIWNTYHLWPRLLPLAALSGLTILGSGIMLMAHTMEIVPSVRYKALLADGASVLALLLSIGIHAAAGRAVDTAAMRRAEQIENQERANRLAEDAARRQRELFQAEASRDQAAYRRTLAEIEKARISGQALPRQQARPTASASVAGQSPAIEAVTASPNASLEWWYWFVLAAFLAEIGVAFLGPIVVYHERIKDRNGNSIPDFVEQLFELDPDRVQREYPEFYRKLTDKNFIKAMEAGPAPK